MRISKGMPSSVFSVLLMACKQIEILIDWRQKTVELFDCVIHPVAARAVSTVEMLHAVKAAPRSSIMYRTVV